MTITVQVGADTVEFPDGTSQEVMQKALMQQFGGSARQPENLIGDFKESASQLPANVVQSLSAYGKPETYEDEAIPGDPSTSNPVTSAANVMRPALDAAGNVAGAGWDAWWGSFGQLLPSGSKATVEEGFRTLMSKPMEAWEDFSKAYPLESALLEDTGVLAELAGPKLKVPQSRGLKKLEVSQRSKASGKSIEERRKGINNLVRTEDPNVVPELRESGVLRSQERTPTQREMDMATTLETFPKVDPNRSYTYNTGEVDRATRGLQKDLNKLLGRHSSTRIPKTEVVEELGDVVENITETPGFNALSSDAQTQALKLMGEAERLIRESGTGQKLRPRDMLKIRQEFDRLFEGAGGSYEASAVGARNFAATQLRSTLNQMLKRYVGDPSVHDLLDRQHEGLKALRILNKKRIAEQTNALSRTWNKMRELGHLPTTPLALYATAGAVGASGLAPAIATGLATGTAAYQIYRGLKGPARNKALAELLGHINRASARDPDFKSAIAPQRAMLIEMMKDIQEPEQEEE